LPSATVVRFIRFRNTSDNGNVIKTFTLFRCVIQSLKLPSGDTASHDHGMMEIVLDIEDFQIG
jgi:hypothetical protein